MPTPARMFASLLSLFTLACERGTNEATSPPASEASESSEASDATASHEGPPIDARAIVAAGDREPGDVEADRRRKPVELLEFLDLRAGMKVADIGAGFGYTTELLARAVGPSGKVYGQNTSFVLDRFARAGWNARIAKPINANVVSLEREFDDPFPADIEPLDRVINVLFYHDFEWMKVDRAKHVADVFAALRPGGLYVIVDASAQAGHGAQDSQTLHRIEESLVIAELEAGGFELVERGEFLRNPDDARDWNGLPWESTEKAGAGVFSDKFVLKFRKPESPSRGR
ncbi:class I SAM-dependent methyltransferase [Nannocystaceae bacterium ST9]